MAIDIRKRQFSVAAAFAIAITVAAQPAWPDSYPSRPIHLIVNYVPGGTGDIIARLIGARLSEEIGQSVVIENRPGAGGTLGARDAVNADPDGYTLTVAPMRAIFDNWGVHHHSTQHGNRERQWYYAAECDRLQVFLRRPRRSPALAP